MATLYLHIGTHKTGTTAIQHFCVRNRAALAKRGFCFPEMPYEFKTVGYERNGTFLMHSDGREKAEGNGSVDEVWRRCMAILSARFREFSNVILSDEGIWTGSALRCPWVWERLRAEAQARNFDVRILVYLRRQDELLESAWAQEVKVPTNERATMRWEEVVPQAGAIYALDYHAHLEEIAAVFGRERVDVRVYDRFRFPDGDVTKDFLSALGLRPEPDYSFIRDLNPSISGNALEIRRVINELHIEDPKARRRIRLAIARCNAQESARETMFSEEERRAFLDRFEASNRLLARDYLGGGDASPFPPPGPMPPKWTPGNPRMYEDVVRFFALALLAPEEEGRWKRAKRELRERVRAMRRKLRWRRELRRALASDPARK